MSSFDEAFRAHIAEQDTQDVQRRSAQDTSRQGAERIVTILTALLGELLHKLSDERVQPCQVWVGDEWSPAGYVLSESIHMNTYHLSDLVMVTLDRQIFRYSSATNVSGLVPLTADNILRGNVPLIGDFKVATAGELVVNVGLDREDWKPFEPNLTNVLAGSAVRIVQESRGQLRFNTKRRRPQPKTRLEEEIDKLKAEIDALQRSINAEESRNRANGKPSYSRTVGKMGDKMYRLQAKYNRLVAKNRPPR
jgi:hypothetical protein